MEKKKQEYHTSFFKPSNKRTKANRNMVLWLISIWAVAVFGFQILLKVLEKPTPEPVWESYQTVKPGFMSENPSVEDYRTFATTNLSVLAKVFIKPAERKLLQKSLSSTLFKITQGNESKQLENEINSFTQAEAQTSDVMDPAYLQAKARLKEHVAPLLELDQEDARIRILPLELTTDCPEELTGEQISKVESIFDRYLIHNRSVLTDTVIFGFPLHYFYTAVFLLVLFVLLCLLYCITADSLNKKYNIQE
jgi:putative solute:sodium symporter small subunit